MQLESVRVAECHFGKRRATARVVDDVLDDTTDVSMALGVVVSPELRWGFVEASVRSEDRAAALPLVANDTTLRTLAAVFWMSSLAMRGWVVVRSYHIC